MVWLMQADDGRCNVDAGIGMRLLLSVWRAFYSISLAYNPGTCAG